MSAVDPMLLERETCRSRVSPAIEFGQLVAFGPFVNNFVSAADVHVLRSRITVRQILAGITGETRRA